MRRADARASSGAESRAARRPGAALRPAQHPRADAARSELVRRRARRVRAVRGRRRARVLVLERAGTTRGRPHRRRTRRPRRGAARLLRRDRHAGATALLRRAPARRAGVDRSRRVRRGQRELPRARAVPGALSAVAHRPGTLRRRVADDQHDHEQGRLRRRIGSGRVHPGLDRHDPAVERTMTMNERDGNGIGRRRVLQGAGVAMIGGLVTACSKPALAQGRGKPAAKKLTISGLGARLQGVQHFGLTVQSMDRAFEFYTEVLGGTEVMRDGDFQGERIHNPLLTDQEIEARERRVNPRTMGVPDLKGGTQRLDVRFIQFDNVVIELLQYRDADQPRGSGNSFAEPRDHMSPAYPRSMHICFYVRDDVDFNKFIRDLEAESARRGMSQVKANRVITVTSEGERQAAPMSSNTNKITEGKSNGWALIYCKGPEGEQLEFVQALDPVKRVFSSALEARRLSRR